ncbi:MAG TPA: 3,4-dihydroxy-2-butanone-4-phosphate synthase [Blastocatellia bacterium]|nr:3,4-dihydroxy-2-butanone-4-phosphate synthase [Blastocatellia bacterium]
MTSVTESVRVFATIPEAVEDIRQGRMIIIVDDEDRENEGDLCCAAEKVTPDIINFMAKHGRGLICLSLTEQRCDELQLPLQVSENTSRFETAFCISIDAREGVTTGISAADRARTILTAVDPRSRPEDLVRPGHIFPLRARRGGVLVRPGQTEASVDLARLAGLTPAGVICEIMNDDGTMARLPQLIEFAAEHGLKIITVADLIRYRLQHETLVRIAAEALIPTPYGPFRVCAFENDLNDEVHLALVRGDVSRAEPVLVRVHTQSVLGDVFGSLVDEAGKQLRQALERIAQEGRGVLLYLIKREGLGQGLVRQVAKHRLIAQGQSERDAAEALRPAWDMRDYGIGAQILYHLGVRRMRLLTNHPKRLTALAGFGLEIVESIPLLDPAGESAPDDRA